jgi:RNA polymerase sigma factor (sigma-70 family)
MDEREFAAIAERHRRELQIHCYGMLGSVEDSEDLVQETFLRAWRRRSSYEGRSTFIAWLYKIATNACLDFLRARPRRVLPLRRRAAGGAGLADGAGGGRAGMARALPGSAAAGVRGRGASPKVREVAAGIGCSVEDVLEAQEAAANYEAASLDAPTARDDDEAVPLVDMMGGDDSAYELVERRDAIASTWKALPDQERKVLELRFTSDLTQREIGNRMGCSQMHVSRLLRRARSTDSRPPQRPPERAGVPDDACCARRLRTASSSKRRGPATLLSPPRR